MPTDVVEPSQASAPPHFPSALTTWTVVFLSLNIVALGLLVWQTREGGSPLAAAGAASSAGALGWSMVAFVDRVGRRRDASRRAAFSGAARLSAIWCGVLCGVLLVYLLAIRGIEVVLEIRHGAPVAAWSAPSIRWSELWAIGGLGMACVIRLAASPDRRLMAPLLWLTVMSVFWSAASLPALADHADGRFSRTPGALAIIAGLSLAIAGFTLGQGRASTSARRHAAMSGPLRTLRRSEWPGIRQSIGVLGVGLVLLIGLQTAVPADREWISPRWAGMVSAAAAALAGTACFHHVSWKWSANFADLAMGLFTVAAGSAAAALIPMEGVGLDAQFPMVFNAWMVALTLMSAMWGWVGRVWKQQLDGSRAWTAAGRMCGLTDGFAYLTVCLGVAMGGLMTVWPRMRPIGEADDSLGRMAAGATGHLLLLLVILWNGRRSGRNSHWLPAVAAGVSLLGFILVRSAPLISQVAPSPR